jgi:hypothetical protein
MQMFFFVFQNEIDKFTLPPLCIYVNSSHFLIIDFQKL